MISTTKLKTACKLPKGTKLFLFGLAYDFVGYETLISKTELFSENA